MPEASAVSLVIQLVFFVEFLLVIYSGTVVEQMWPIVRTSWPVQDTASISLQGLRRIMTNLRIADVLAEIQTQYLPNMGLEHGHYARLLILLGTVCLGTEVLSMLSESHSNLQSTNTASTGGYINPSVQLI
jgi:hypothetical protein